MQKMIESGHAERAPMAADVGHVWAVRRDDSQLIDQQKQIVLQQTQTESLLKEILSLKENKQQSKELVQLKSCVDKLEQYIRSEDILITGLKVQNCTYTRAATVSEEVNDSAKEGENLALENQVNFMASKGIHIKEVQVSACHFLSRVDKDGVKKIIMRFVNRKDKVAVLKARKKSTMEVMFM